MPSPVEVQPLEDGPQQDGDGTGEYRAGDIRLGFDTIDRPDVAAFILDCLEDDLYVGEMPKVGSA